MGGYGGGMGGMGGMYGGGMYGGGMYGGMGGGMGGMGGMGMPGDPNSLTNSFNNSTQATFQMLEGIVTAFGGFAQMLESTYMATHSSFFGMYEGLNIGDQQLTGTSYGFRRRAVWQSTRYAGVHSRHLYCDALD